MGPETNHTPPKLAMPQKVVAKDAQQLDRDTSPCSSTKNAPNTAPTTSTATSTAYLVNIKNGNASSLPLATTGSSTTNAQSKAPTSSTAASSADPTNIEIGNEALMQAPAVDVATILG